MIRAENGDRHGEWKMSQKEFAKRTEIAESSISDWKVEAWGSDIGRILSAAREYGLPTPSVEVFDNMFRVNLFRKVQENGNKDDFGEDFGESFRVNGGEDFGDKSGMRRDGHKLTDTQRKVLDYIAEDKYISAREMADKIGVSGRTIENNLKN